MCGVAGCLSVNRLNKLQHQSELVDIYIADRGPDYADQAMFNSEGLRVTDTSNVSAIMWHKRLSIIDVSSDGNQPMTDTDNNTIVFNGEIYNYLEIKTQLEKEGIFFHTHSDTEVILAAYRKWGVQCFEKFIGMFAIALYDTKQHLLIMAKDSLGIKPLYYYHQNGELFFSSRADLTAALANTTKVQLNAAYNFMQFAITDNDANTFYEGVSSFLPGQVMVFSVEDLTLKQSFFIDYQKTAFEIGPITTHNEKSAALKYILTETLKMHTRTDVGFCTTLSGGLDSSSIIGILKKSGIDELNPYSYIPSEKNISEEHWIDIVAKSNDLTVRKITYDSNDFWNDFPDFVKACDMPVNTASMYSQYKIYQAIAASGNKVVLDGQGGDEMFGGYVQYLYYKGYEDIWNGKLISLLQLLKGAKQTVPLTFLVNNIFRLSAFNAFPQLYNKLRIMGNDAIIHKHFLYTNNAIQSVNYEAGTLKQRIINDLKLQDLPRLLRYADRSSMRWSLESRVPFATQPIMAFMEKMEATDFVSNNGTTKALFREVVKEFLPSEIYERRDKKGFNTSYEHILYSQQMVSFIDGIPKHNIPLLHKETLIKALQKKVPYDSNKLWRIASLCSWIHSKKMTV